MRRRGLLRTASAGVAGAGFGVGICFVPEPGGRRIAGR
ncbi:twin-arginine translocation signal domain-containing protein [Sphingomonas sp. 10B4]